MKPRPPLDLGDFCGLKDIDVVGLYHGYKRIISTGLDARWAARLRASAARYGFCMSTVGRSHDYRGESRTYIIARRRADVDAARAAYAARDYRRIGRLLGYPPCCVARYAASLAEDGAAFVRRCAEASRRFLWPLNNVLDYDGRVVNRRPAVAARLRHNSLISHNPCSYDCPASLDLARRNWEHLLPHKTEAGLRRLFAPLARPVLYADDYNFAILEGRSTGGGAVFAGAAVVVGLRAAAARLRRGGRVELGGRGFTVSGGGAEPRDFRTAGRPLLLAFDGDKEA